MKILPPHSHHIAGFAARPQARKTGSLLLALAGAAFLGLAGLGLAQDAHDQGKGPVVKVLSAVDVNEELSGKPARATTFEVTFGPGIQGAPHRHPGPIYGYVLEGTLEFQAGDNPLLTLKAGDTFYEPSMVLHAVSRNPSVTTQTRILAVLVHARDAKELVISEPAKAGK